MLYYSIVQLLFKFIPRYRFKKTVQKKSRTANFRQSGKKSSLSLVSNPPTNFTVDLYRKLRVSAWLLTVPDASLDGTRMGNRLRG